MRFFSKLFHGQKAAQKEQPERMNLEALEKINELGRAGNVSALLRKLKKAGWLVRRRWAGSEWWSH